MTKCVDGKVLKFLFVLCSMKTNSSREELFRSFDTISSLMNLLQMNLSSNHWETDRIRLRISENSTHMISFVQSIRTDFFYSNTNASISFSIENQIIFNVPSARKTNIQTFSKLFSFFLANQIKISGSSWFLFLRFVEFTGPSNDHVRNDNQTELFINDKRGNV